MRSCRSQRARLPGERRHTTRLVLFCPASRGLVGKVSVFNFEAALGQGIVVLFEK